MMKCEEVHPNLGAFALGGLESEEDTEIRRHLALCPSCREKLKEFEEVRQALEVAPPLADPPPHLKNEILSYIRAEESHPSNGELPPFRRGSRSRALRLLVPGAAAAALVAVIALGTFFGLHTEAPVATIQ